MGEPLVEIEIAEKKTHDNAYFFTDADEGNLSVKINKVLENHPSWNIKLVSTSVTWNGRFQLFTALVVYTNIGR